jgi:hypothetical protein
MHKRNTKQGILLATHEPSFSGCLAISADFKTIRRYYNLLGHWGV